MLVQYKIITSFHSLVVLLIEFTKWLFCRHPDLPHDCRHRHHPVTIAFQPVSHLLH